jgi:hypothetical protein
LLQFKVWAIDNWQSNKFKIEIFVEGVSKQIFYSNLISVEYVGGIFGNNYCGDGTYKENVQLMGALMNCNISDAY